MDMRSILDVGVPETSVDSGTTQLFHIDPTGAINPQYECTPAKWAGNTVLLTNLKTGSERLALVEGDEDPTQVEQVLRSGSQNYEGLWARKSDIKRLRLRHIVKG